MSNQDSVSRFLLGKPDWLSLDKPRFPPHSKDKALPHRKSGLRPASILEVGAVGTTTELTIYEESIFTLVFS